MLLDEIEPELIEPQRLAASTIDALRLEHRRPGRQGHLRMSYRDALRALHFESFLVAVSASNLANGVELTDDDRARLIRAHHLINSIMAEVDV